MTKDKINWNHIHDKWTHHWMNKPDDYTPGEWLDKFWDELGGRELYFREDGDKSYQREYKEN